VGGIISEWVGGIIPESWAACSGIRKSSLFTTSDSDGDTVTQYAFWNTGAGGGRFLIGGIAQATSHEIDVLASQLSQVTYQPGTEPDTVCVRANDGYVWGAWSQSFKVSPWIDTPPIVTVSNMSAAHGQSFAASTLFTASDPDGDTITKYAFWTNSTGGGHFVLNRVTQGTNQEIDVTAAQLSQLGYQSGSGADTLWVRSNDGAQWSPWSNSFTVTAPIDSGPPTDTRKRQHIFLCEPKFFRGFAVHLRRSLWQPRRPI
jgi:hypothetical protein